MRQHPPFLDLIWQLIQNKSNSTAGAVQVEANLPGIRCLYIFFSKCMTRKCFTLKIKVMVTEYNIHNVPILWQMSTSIKLALEHLFSRYSHLKIRDLENVGQGDDIQTCSGAIRWYMPNFLSDGNCNICIFRAFTCQNSYLKGLTLKFRLRSRSTIFTMTPFDGKCQNLQNVILKNYYFR